MVPLYVALVLALVIAVAIADWLVFVGAAPVDPHVQSFSAAPFSNFVDWFVGKGGVVNKIGVGSFPDMGLGIVANDALTKGEVILQIPLDIIFSASSLTNSKDPLHARLAQILPPEEAVLFAVLIEKLRGRSSVFEPYISLLPGYVPSLTRLSDTELDELHDEKLKTRVMQLQKTRSNLFTTSMAKLKAAKLDMSAEIMKQITLDSYLWANSILDSRGLRFSGKVYLAPFADFFNYKPHPEMRRSDAGKFYLDHHKLLEKENRLVVSVDRDYHSAGSQVFEDYGDNDDTIYAIYHGFVPDENPFRCFPVQGVDYHSLPPTTQHFIDDLGFMGGYAPSSCISAALGDLDKGLEVYLTAISMTPEQIQDCTQVITQLRRDKLPISKVYTDCELGATYHRARKLLLLLRRSSEAASNVDKDSNEWRIIENIQKSIQNSTNQLWRTTVDEDISEKLTLLDELEKHDPADVRGVHHLQHQILAVRYRIASKQAYQQLRRYFLLDNDQPVAQPPMAATSVDDAKIAGNESPSAMMTMDADEQLRQEIKEFNIWFQAAIDDLSRKSSESWALSRVEAAVIPGFRIGTVASSDIQAEEIYLGVPTTIVMDADKAAADFDSDVSESEVSLTGDMTSSGRHHGVGELIRKLAAKYSNRDSFHELLFFLLSEKFIKRERSKYHPYLRLLPTLEQLDIPLLWDADTVQKRLFPSDSIIRTIGEYQQKVRKTFDFVSNISEVREFFTMNDASTHIQGDSEGEASSQANTILTYENYLWATAILDSRSIWWEGQRHLVPMLDFVNCQEGPSNPARVHSTTTMKTTAGDVVAVTRAPWAFQRGDQVFENYGQPNHIYFMYHGFVLPGNTHDCLHIDFVMTEKELDDLKSRSKAVELGQVGYALISTICL